MEIISTSTLSASIHVKVSGNGRQPVAVKEDIVSERNLVGTTRTMVNRLGFGSPEMTLDIWCTASDYAVLNSMRGSTVAFRGSNWDLTFNGDVVKIRSQVTDIYELKIRLKQV